MNEFTADMRDIQFVLYEFLKIEALSESDEFEDYNKEVFDKYKKLIRQRSHRVFPVISIIPAIHGAVWEDGKPRSEGVAFEEIRHAVIKAVGQDLAGPGE